MFDLGQAINILELSMANYSDVRATYWAEVYDAVYEYLTTEGSRITAYKNRIKKAMANAFNLTGEIAYEDGGNKLPMDPDTQSWLASKQAAEFAYIDVLFESLRALRKDEEFNPLTDAISEAFTRADGYAKTLDGVYSNIKVMSSGSKMLTLVGKDGLQSCPECQKYKGQRHRASWWVGHNLVPGKGSAYSCGGWNCFHVLVDDNGMLYTL